MRHMASPAKQKYSTVTGLVSAPGALSTGASRQHPTTMTAVMSRLLAEGTAFPAIVKRATGASALRQGAPADIAVFDVNNGKVRCVLTMRNGDAVWDAHGLTMREWTQAGPYSNYR